MSGVMPRFDSVPESALSVSGEMQFSSYCEIRDHHYTLAMEPAGKLVDGEWVKVSFTEFTAEGRDFQTGWFSKTEFRRLFEFARRAQLPIDQSYRLAFKTLFPSKRQRKVPEIAIPRVPAEIDFRA